MTDTATIAGVPPAIRVRHLWHRFGSFEVLQDVTFDVQQGEIFGFIGPNGAGKTTTIRIMATLLEPMAGKVEIDGWDVTIDPGAVRKAIGYMPDHSGVYERVTVREYLEFFADAYRVPTARTTYAVVDAVMELTALTKLGDKLVATMSKGLKQRLQLARTLLHDPKVLILDEPASDLDPRARIEMRDLLVELRAMGKTIFLSSHILTELADICTSVAILEHGRLVVAGPIANIVQRLEAARAEREDSREELDPGRPTAATEDAPTPSTEIAPGATQAIRTLRIKALTQSETICAAVRAMPCIKGISPGPTGTTVIQYLGDERTVAQIVRLLVTSGVPIVGVEPERNDLERIFSR